MKIVEFNVPEPEPTPEPTFEEELRAELDEFNKPKVVEAEPVVIAEVDPLEEEIRSQFEAAYDGNLGMMEVMQFYKEASPKFIELFKRLLDADKQKEAWQLVQKVTGTKLVGQQFNEDPMVWTDDGDADMVNPMPIVGDDDVYEFMDEVDGTIAEKIPGYRNLSRVERIEAFNKMQNKVGAVQEVPINQIVSTEKYLFKDQIKAIMGGKAKSSSSMPVLYKQGNTYYPGDGNHRIVATYLSKQNTVKGLVLDAQKILEGVGLIRKGSNVTPDVGEAQTRIEAEKLGFKTSDDGIPPLLRTNGKNKVHENVMEGVAKASFTVSNVRDWVWDNMNAEAFNSGDCGTFAMMLGALFTDVEYYEIRSDHSEGMHFFVKVNGQPVDASGEYSSITELVSMKDYYEPNVRVLEVTKGKVRQAGAGTEEEAFKLATEVYNGLTSNRNVTEALQLNELKMAPGHLQKEVNKILHIARPKIGLEFEVCFGNDEEGNPDITKYTTYDDIKDFFVYDDDDSFRDMRTAYDDWIGEKGAEWTKNEVNDTLGNPSDESTAKIEFMVNDYVPNSDADEAIARMTGSEDDIELTEELAEECIARADQIFKTDGPAYEWPVQPGMDPFVLLYHEIFVEDNEEATDHFSEAYNDRFYQDELPYDDQAYSVGTYLRSVHLNSMGDVWREWSDTLTWTGGAMSGEEFDENLAQGIADEMNNDLGIETEVGDGWEPGDSSVDYSTWRITSDASIVPNNEGDAPMEIITSIMDYEEGIADVEEFIDYLKDKNAYANESTGLHINVSMGNISHDDLDYAKLVVMLGDSHILKQFGREFNEYAENSLTRLGSLMDPDQGYARDKPEKAKAHAILMSKMKTNLSNVVAKSFGKMQIDKYNSVGLKDNRIEFRSAGGSDYLNNFSAILSLINRFIVAYTVAADPEAHKKEYGKKLYKLASNVGQGQVSKSSMTLFAGFGAGIISKEDLIKQLKAKRNAGKPDNAEPVDTGEPKKPKTIPRFVELEDEEEAIDIIAKRFHYTYPAAKTAWEQGVGAEMVIANNPGQAMERAYNNLIRDEDYYSGPPESGF